MVVLANVTDSFAFVFSLLAPTTVHDGFDSTAVRRMVQCPLQTHTPNPPHSSQSVSQSVNKEGALSPSLPPSLSLARSLSGQACLQSLVNGEG